MRVAVMTAPGEVRVEDRPEPVIVEPTDAIVRLTATCICGSDLWPYRGVERVDGRRPMGHEYAGIVEEVGSAVSTVRPGQFVVGSFFASDNTCEICRSGYQSSCVRREAAAPGGAQAERMRVPLADGTLVAPPASPPMIWYRACWRPRMSSAPAGSPPSPPKPAPARPSPWSVTAPSGSSASWPPNSSARSASSR
jgi:threonine dehydrogenase-like Zn-dependent dehydrogenase